MHLEEDWIPFNFTENGEAEGYSNYLIKKIAELLNLKIDFVKDNAWSDTISKIKNREIDIVTNLSVSDERKEFILFSDPVMELVPSFICRKNETITKMDELKNRKLAILEGVWIEKQLKKDYPDISFLYLKSESEAYRAVSEGTADAAISYMLSAEYYIKTHFIDNIHISSPVEEINGGKDLNYIGTRRDWPLLASSINKALDHILKKKENRLSASWIRKHIIDRSEKIDDNYSSIRELEETLEKSLNNYSFESRRKVWFSKEETEYLKRKKEIKMCVDPKWLPIEGIDENGDYTGMGADIISKLEKRTGIKFELLPTESWSETIENAKERKCDIITMAGITDERKKYLDFTSPYVSLPLVIATGENSLFVPNFNALSGKSVALVENTSYYEVLKKRYPQINIIPAESPLEALNMTARGRIFGFIAPLPTIAYAIQFYDFKKLKIGGGFDLYWDLSIATRNDEPILRDIMEKALSTLSEAEKINEYNLLYSFELVKKTDRTVLWRIISVFLSLLAIILLWNRSLLKSRERARTALEKLEKVQKKLKEQNRELEILAATDKLTGLCNRIRLDEVLEMEIERCRRYDSPLALILLDMDFFKSVNDTYGHQTGDRLLVHVSEILKKINRKTDTTGRWGGEEFIIICPMSDREAVIAHAEKIRKAVQDNPLEETGKRTVSCGTAVFSTDDSASTLTSRADKALYIAKSNGRNCVEFL